MFHLSEFGVFDDYCCWTIKGADIKTRTRNRCVTYKDSKS